MQPTAMRFANLRNQSLTTRVSLLGLTVLCLYGVVSPAAGYWGGTSGLWAAAAAAALCLAGTAAALVVSHPLRGPKYVWYSLFLGTLFRTGVPLGAGLACILRGGALAEAGMLVYLLVFYPLTLVLETILSLPSGSRDRHRADISQNATP